MKDKSITFIDIKLREQCNVVHVIAECKDCSKVFDSYKNGQALAAEHAKRYGHEVYGEIGLAFVYDGRPMKELEDND